MNVTARQYATGAENIASAHAIRQKLLRPPVRQIKAAEAPGAPVVRRSVPRLPTWQWDEVQFDAHVKAFWRWQMEQGNRCKSYIKVRASDLGFTYMDFVGRSRKHLLVMARQTVMWEIKTIIKPSISWPELARLFGGRDHTTAMHAVRKIERLKARGEI